MPIDQYPLPPWLAPEQKWPPVVNGEDYGAVWDKIRQNRDLFKGEHEEVYEDQLRRITGGVDKPDDWTPRTIQEALLKLKMMPKAPHLQAINLPQALSLLWADLVGGRAPRVMPSGAASDSTPQPDTEEELALNRLAEEMHAEVQESLAEQSYAGDGVLVARLEPQPDGKLRARLIAFPADQWIPWSSTGDPKNITAHILFRQEKHEGEKFVGENAESILTVEIHYRGLVRYRRYRVGGGVIQAELAATPPPGAPPDHELPKLSFPTVQPYRNFGTPRDFRGISDYDAFDSLCAEFDVRASQWGIMNDRFTAPVMSGPSSVLVANPVTGEWEYKTSPDGKFIPRDKDDPDVQYVVWDPQFQMQLQTWDRLMDLWYIVTGTTPAAFSVFNKEGGGNLSGSALRLRMARPLQVASRKRQHLLPALKRALLVAQELEVYYGGARYKPSLPLIDWPDNMPNDPKEAAETEKTRMDAGLTTRADALMRLDGISEAEAHAKAEEIANEKATEDPLRGVVIPGSREGLNGPGSGAAGSGAA